MTLDNNLEGTVLRIERSSIHDGRGLRTVLFLKGCPLKCAWCSTPESQQIEPEKGYDAGRCTACGRCIKACPSRSLSLSADRNSIITDSSRCLLCFKCAEMCPNNAVKKYGYTLSLQEVIREISKDEIFYFYSNGGVTISGGEPLSQPDFVLEILRECKLLAINTALESSLHVNYHLLDQILPYLDLLYVDIKHMDSAIHYSWTGEGNGLIMENINKTDCSDYPLEVVVRVPLIPGFNDSDQNLIKTIEYCAKLNKLKAIELLPYHRLGINTYNYIGKEFRCKQVIPPSSEQLLERAHFLRKQNSKIPVRVGSGFILE